MNKEKRVNMFAHKFEYRSPLWIESDSDVSKSSGEHRGGLCSNSDDSIQCQSSTDSSTSVNNYLDSKVSTGRGLRKGNFTHARVQLYALPYIATCSNMYNRAYLLFENDLRKFHNKYVNHTFCLHLNLYWTKPTTYPVYYLTYYHFESRWFFGVRVIFLSAEHVLRNLRLQ